MSKAKIGTFSPNKNKPFFSWYQYAEGYSDEFVASELKNIGSVDSIYDPFGGSGTTMLYASLMGIDSFYSEVNPVMQWVTETKINSSIDCARNIDELTKNYAKLINSIEKNSHHFSETYIDNGFDKFFDSKVLGTIIEIKNIIKSMTISECNKRVFMLGLVSNIVEFSRMIKRGDLRYATDKEMLKKNWNVVDVYKKTTSRFIEDIKNFGVDLKKKTIKLSDDSRNVDKVNFVDCIITSPPYLNGTNYIRNTKLELFLLDFISDEKELPIFHSKGIIAGINNVSKQNGVIEYKYNFVQDILDQLNPVTYDSRIPKMIESYFDNMADFFSKMIVLLKHNGKLILDIGDSQFSGVHVPTHEILEKIAFEIGFRKDSEEILRKRTSNNGMILSQRILRFSKKDSINTNDSFRKTAELFINSMPYTEQPFNSRNWGHDWHSLCSYQGKLKPALAHHLINTFTRVGDRVLDPLCGVGTIPFEACLQGRIGIGNDMSSLAYTVTTAKVNKPSYNDVINVLNMLDEYIELHKRNTNISDYSDFGFNGKIPTYFHPDTYSEILAARSYFTRAKNDSATLFVKSCMLHILHGNRPYALSRNSHPLTPYAPTGDFIYKNVITHIRNKIELSFKKNNFDDYIVGESYNLDYNMLPSHVQPVDWIITSPPFADSIRFYVNNWMRLWFSGWEPTDFKKADTQYIEGLQKKTFDVYISFFDMCYKVLKPQGKVILHLGKTVKTDMAKELSDRIGNLFDVTYIGEENVEDIEKHGIKDKGATLIHQYLFLTKK